MSTLIMKFGGAAVADSHQFARIAEIVIAKKNEFSNLVVVVSAMGKTTDSLIDLAKAVHPNPPQREYDMLISTGERVSMSLLAMALCLKHQKAVSFTGSQSGIITSDQHSEAKIIDVRPYRIQNSLKEGNVVIVGGFQGISELKEITTLGRGGSDTTAVALGIALRADRVEFFKDVPAIFSADPKVCVEAIPYTELTYEEALEIANKGSKVLHYRAIDLAKKNGLPLHVRSFIPSYRDQLGTNIYNRDQARAKHPIYESII